MQKAKQPRVQFYSLHVVASYDKRQREKCRQFSYSYKGFTVCLGSCGHLYMFIKYPVKFRLLHRIIKSKPDAIYSPQRERQKGQEQEKRIFFSQKGWPTVLPILPPLNTPLHAEFSICKRQRSLSVEKGLESPHRFPSPWRRRKEKKKGPVSGLKRKKTKKRASIEGGGRSGARTQKNSI